MLIIGPAGSGKTTMSKRIVLQTFEQDNFSLYIPLAFIVADKPIDIKYFLFKLSVNLFSGNTDFSEEDMDTAFAWLLVNQNKVSLVLDGLDQARLQLNNVEIPPFDDINKKYQPSELISLILSRKILPGLRLILTSRPHSVLNFDSNIQPNFTVYLDDLAHDDMKRLMRFFINADCVELLIEKIMQKSPKVQQLVYCPLFLRLFCQLYNTVEDDEIWTTVQSTANLFDELLTRLQHSAHNASEFDEDGILDNLSKLAYEKTMSGSVVITQEDLINENIESDMVQDLVIGLHGDTNSALVGPSLFYFAHQSIQVSLKLNY